MHKRYDVNRGERGLALILAIGFLAVLSIIGAVMMNLVTQGLGTAGRFEPEQRAFYMADRAVEYAMNRDIIVNLPMDGTVNLVGDIAKDANGNNLAGNPTHKAIIENSTIGTLISGTVEDVGPSALPPALAEVHGTEFGANFYHVTVEARAPGAPQNSHVDASIVRLFKLDDDTIFRTGGGG